MKAMLAALLVLCPLAGASAASVPLSRVVAVDGIDIHFLDTGGGPATLLLVHGWCGSSADFQPMLLRMPPEIRCIAVDLPGCGASGKPEIEYDIPFFVDFLSSFCGTMGLDRFVLAGHSMGGQVAAHFVRKYPDRVEKLILLDPYGLEGEEGGWLPLARLGGLVEVGFRLNTRLIIEMAVRGNLLYRPSQGVVDWLVDSTARSIMGPEGSRATASITRNVIGRDPVDGILPGIAQRTLVIWGANDRLLAPRWGERFVALLPNATLETIPLCGHMPTLEKPEEIAGLIAGFIGRENPRGREHRWSLLPCRGS